MTSRFSGFADIAMASSAEPIAASVKLEGRSSNYTHVAGEGIVIKGWRVETNGDAGFHELYLSYDADGTTKHIPILKGKDRAGSSGQHAWWSVEYERHITYPSPAGTTWKIWTLGPNSAAYQISVFGNIV